VVIGVDALDELVDLLRVEVIGGNGDALPPGLVDQLGRLLDRLGAVVLGALRAGAAARAVDRRPGLTQRDGDAPAGAAGGAGDQRDLARQWFDGQRG
jgi:hypothetical protein